MTVAGRGQAGDGAVSHDRRRIGVAPAGSIERFARLFAALEATHDVSFEPCAEPPEQGLDGVLRIAPQQADADAHPAGGTPSLTIAAAALQPRGSARTIRFAEDPALAAPLRGRSLCELDAPAPHPTSWSDRALASIDGTPIWLAREGSEHEQLTTVPLRELARGETLRSHLSAGRFAALLPLLHLIWHVCGANRWEGGPLQACFVIDDPNLHRCSYGHLDYAALASRARLGGYHVAIATVPLDAWVASPRAVALLRANGAHLSLLVHGNDHTARELGRLRSAAQAEAAIAQALRRIARLERRTGLSVGRVMAPPHGACSQEAMRAMFRLGLDAACISRPYPWLPAEELPVSAGWAPAELVAGGMPVLPRHPLDGAREDLILRALLGQPLILYCHQRDLADLEALDDAAAQIDRLGEVEWRAPQAIARAGYQSRRDGDRLLVRLHSRRVTVEAGDCSSLIVQARHSPARPLWDALSVGARRVAVDRGERGWQCAEVAVEVGERVELALEATRPLDPRQAPAPRAKLWPIVRRGLVEARDRAEPLVQRRAVRERRPGAPERRRVHHFGPDPAYVGGIGSVIAVMAEHRIGGASAEVTPSWRPGSRLSSIPLAIGAGARLSALPADDVVHVHLAEGGAFIREGGLLLLARALGRPTVATIHGSRFLTFAERHPRIVARVLRAAGVITCLDPNVQEVARRLAPDSRVELMANPVVVEEQARPADETEEVVLFAGEIGLRKGVDVLCEAWRHLSAARPAARCLIVGPRADYLLPTLPRLEILRPVQRDQVGRLLSEARVVALPSRAEGMPMILTEAMAAARPFVSTPVGGIAALAPGGRLVAVGDAAALAAQLEAFLSDSELAREVGQRGRELCIRTRSVEVISELLGELYTEAARRRVRARPTR
jgi:glycosyltransferase involved in cell wall biosynthesis